MPASQIALSSFLKLNNNSIPRKSQSSTKSSHTRLSQRNNYSVFTTVVAGLLSKPNELKATNV
jgi:hypothetical protein